MTTERSNTAQADDPTTASPPRPPVAGTPPASVSRPASAQAPLGWRLVGITSLASAALAVIVGLVAKPANAQTPAGVLAALLGLLPVLLGGMAGMAAFRTIGAKGLAVLPAAVMASSGARMLVSIAGGLALYFLILPEPRAFWLSLLFSALAGLILETRALAGFVRAAAGSLAPKP